MVIRHLWGFYTSPKEEWKFVEHSHEDIFESIRFVLLTALIPAVCIYISTVHIGWKLTAEIEAFLTPSSALYLMSALYVALIAGVAVLAYLVKWMSHTFDSAPSYSQSFGLVAYASTPLFMSVLGFLYPYPMFVMFVGLLGVAYSVYLLYSGVPILMHISEERGFIYASSLVTCSLVLFVATLAFTVILWSSGLGPDFITLSRNGA